MVFAALRSRLGAVPRHTSVLQKTVRFAGGKTFGYGTGEYRGFKMPKVDSWKESVAEVYGTLMFFWIFYRFKQDGKALFVSCVLLRRTMRR